ncbi:glycosyltransferase, partial [Planctomycetaceae bacterium]|nr:glycosyltransferase [Planctomycetaceae bacterium]
DQVRPFSQDWHEHLKLTIGEVACQQLGFYAIPDHITVSVVIPVYNEEATLEKILDRVCAVPILKEIVLVDDYSIDDSAKIIESLKEKYSEDPLNTLKSYNHSRNRGKGAAIRTGFENVTGEEIEVRILRVDTAERKIGLSLKLDATPEEIAAEATGETDKTETREELKGGTGGGSGPLFALRADEEEAAAEDAAEIEDAPAAEETSEEVPAEETAEIEDAPAAEETSGEAPAEETDENQESPDTDEEVKLDDEVDNSKTAD